MNQNARYIVFVLDSKFKGHDGKVFTSYQAAKEWATDYISEVYIDKCVVGMFVEDGTKEMNITYIESFGFKKDKKNINQLDLFK